MLLDFENRRYPTTVSMSYDAIKKIKEFCKLHRFNFSRETEAMWLNKIEKETQKIKNKK